MRRPGGVSVLLAPEIGTIQPSAFRAEPEAPLFAQSAHTGINNAPTTRCSHPSPSFLLFPLENRTSTTSATPLHLPHRSRHWRYPYPADFDSPNPYRALNPFPLSTTVSLAFANHPVGTADFSHILLPFLSHTSSCELRIPTFR